MGIFQFTVIFVLIQNCCCVHTVSDLMPYFESEVDVLHNISSDSAQIIELQSTEDNLKGKENAVTEFATESNETVQEEDHNRNDTLENEIGSKNRNSSNILELSSFNNQEIDPIIDNLRNNVVIEESSSEQKQDKKRSSIFNSFFSEESRSDPNSLINIFFDKKFYTASKNQQRNTWPEENESWVYDCDTENWDTRAVDEEKENWGSLGGKNKESFVIVQKTPEILQTDKKIQYQYNNKLTEHRQDIKKENEIVKHHISKRPGVETIYEIFPEYFIDLPLPDKQYNFKNDYFGTNRDTSKLNIEEETDKTYNENKNEIIFNLLPYYEKKHNFSENIYSQLEANLNVLPLIEEKQKEKSHNFPHPIEEQVGYNFLLPHYDRKNNFHDKLSPLLGYHTESHEHINGDSILFQQSQKTQEEQHPIQQGDDFTRINQQVSINILPQPTPAEFIASDISATDSSETSSGSNTNLLNNNFYYIPQELQSDNQITGAALSTGAADTSTSTYQHNIHEYRVPTSLPQGGVFKNIVNYFPVTLNQYPEQPTRELDIKSIQDQVYSYGVPLVNQIPGVVSSYQTLGTNVAAYGQNFVVDSRPTLGYQVGVVQNPIAFQNGIRLENPVANNFIQVPLNFKHVQEYVRVFGSPVVYTTLG